MSHELVRERARDAADPELEVDLLQGRDVAGLETVLNEAGHLLFGDAFVVDAIEAAGLGITNLVARATARADELTDDEVRAGVAPLRNLVSSWQPGFVAFLGISTYRIAFAAPKARVGAQSERFETARVWALPNPSGLNAHYQQPALTAAYAELREAAFG